MGFPKGMCEMYEFQWMIEIHQQSCNYLTKNVKFLHFPLCMTSWALLCMVLMIFMTGDFFANFEILS